MPLFGRRRQQTCCPLHAQPGNVIPAQSRRSAARAPSGPASQTRHALLEVADEINEFPPLVARLLQEQLEKDRLQGNA